MTKFTIVPLSEDLADKIRGRMKGDFQHDVITQVATGLGPCRVLLNPLCEKFGSMVLHM